MKRRNWIRWTVIGALLVAVAGCNGGDLTKSAAPVVVVMTVASQPIQQFDLAASDSTACQGNIAEVDIQARTKNPSPTAGSAGLTDVRLTSYQVVYTRTDGGTQVPPPYVRSMDMLVTTGGAAAPVLFHLGDFGSIFTQAPFAALNPASGSGGVDPVTGRPRVKFNITLTVFGETLGGDKVSATTTFPLDFCYNCGGCLP